MYVVVIVGRHGQTVPEVADVIVLGPSRLHAVLVEALQGPTAEPSVCTFLEFVFEQLTLQILCIGRQGA